MGAGRTDEPWANQERLTVARAASALGITEGAVRSRIKRGTLRTVKEGGTVFVLLGDGTSQANKQPNNVVAGDQSALIEALRDQIEDLRRERDEWREQARMTDRLLSAAMERIPPRLEAPQGASETAETVEAAPDSAEPHSTTGGAQEDAQTLSETAEATGSAAIPILLFLLGLAIVSFFAWFEAYMYEDPVFGTLVRVLPLASLAAGGTGVVVGGYDAGVRRNFWWFWLGGLTVGVVATAMVRYASVKANAPLPEVPMEGKRLVKSILKMTLVFVSTGILFTSGAYLGKTTVLRIRRGKVADFVKTLLSVAGVIVPLVVSVIGALSAGS